ncbi:MAG: hypothetical protein IKZ50_01495 [Bacteroidales bacterium]|nr:hypothetical protein [Bacteroidales bacterium]
MKSRLVGYFLKPLLVVKKNRTPFILWVLSTLIAGNFGLVFNIIIRGNVNGLSIWESLSQDLRLGSLFLFSIVLLSSSFGSVLTNFISKNDRDFFKPKVIWLGVSVIVWILCGVEYASYMSAQLPPFTSNNCLNVWQLLFFVLSIILSIYAYCLVVMEAKDPDFASISDDYDRIEEQNIEHITNSQAGLTKDSEEIKL